MTWNTRFKEALFTAAIVGAYTLFRTMGEDDPSAMYMASRAGEAAFMTLAAQMGIALQNARGQTRTSESETGPVP